MIKTIAIDDEPLALQLVNSYIAKTPFLESVASFDNPLDAMEFLSANPVDLIFLLLAPEGAGADHLKALARIARLLRDQDVAKKLRASRDAPAIYSVLALPPASAA